MISEYWLNQNKLKHFSDENWGVGGLGFCQIIDEFAKEIGAQTILDYGCGKGFLAQLLRDRGYSICNYDPATHPKLPETPADLVVCTDVLEHVEYEYLDDVLNNIKQLAMAGVFFSICMKPAINLMPDGTNAHKIIQNKDFWVKEISKNWLIQTCKEINKDVLIITGK